jgi:hypothetical protein
MHYYDRDSQSRNSTFGLPDSEGLGGTPLNDAIISMMQIFPLFKQKYNLDIVHTVILTDGDGTSSLYGYERNDNNELVEKDWLNGDSGKIYCRYKNSPKMWELNEPRSDKKLYTNEKSKRNKYSYSHQLVTSKLIEMYKDITGSKMIGFYVAEGDTGRRTITKMSSGQTDLEIGKLHAQFDAQHFAEIKQKGYDSYYIVPTPKNLLTQSEEIKFGPSTQENLIYSQYIQSQSQKRTNRIILSKFMDHIA